MIAVIADDLTGAAELAGIGLDYQLKTEVNTVVEPACEVDLLIIATDTRSLTAAEAKRITFDITCQLMALKPKLIFKKIDSVLRGHVLDEVASQLEASGLKRALIIPGNPQHGKKVISGTYYYNHVPVHLTDYSIDPAFPVSSSNVREMLRADAALPLLKKNEKLPDTGLVIGEAATEHDFKYWTKQADDNTIFAGASCLFKHLLKHLMLQQCSVVPPHSCPSATKLFVFGSTFHQGKYHKHKCFINNIPVVYIPLSIIGDNNLQAPQYERYAGRVVHKLAEHRSAIIAIHPDTTRGLNIDPVLLTRKISLIVKYIHQQNPLHELLIEGGATAWAILAQLNISKLYPLEQLSPGVIRMEIADNNQLYVTLKPGSYEWPAPVWETKNL
jgi:uncharacterized protein YgbK (DUF1537 family)